MEVLFGPNSPTAPFRQYNKTDEEVIKEGYETGLNWPARWDHVPGGPYYPAIQTHRSDYLPEYLEYAKLTRHHNKIWVEAWHNGVREAAKSDPKLKAMLSKLVAERLIQA